MNIKSLSLFLFSQIFLFGQAEPVVSKSMIGSINYNQTAHDNWAQGGEDVLSWFFDVKGDYKKEADAYVLQGSGHANYGRTKISDADARKSSDELKLDLLYTRKLGWTVDPYVSAQLLTQIAPGYVLTDSGDVQVSAFMDPGYMNQTLGIGYSVGEGLALRAGASLKETVSDNYPNSPDDEKMKTEFGFMGEVDFKKQLGEKSVITSEIDLFSNLDGLEAIDVIWDTNINSKVSEYIQFGFQYKVFYDQDVSVKRQIKSVISLGLSYTIL